MLSISDSLVLPGLTSGICCLRYWPISVSSCITVTGKLKKKLLLSQANDDDNNDDHNNNTTVKEVCEEGYKYLGILELDKVKEQEMKGIFRNEYKRRQEQGMKSKLNGGNKIN